MGENMNVSNEFSSPLVSVRADSPLNVTSSSVVYFYHDRSTSKLSDRMSNY